MKNLESRVWNLEWFGFTYHRWEYRIKNLGILYSAFVTPIQNSETGGEL